MEPVDIGFISTSDWMRMCKRGKTQWSQSLLMLLQAVSPINALMNTSGASNVNFRKISVRKMI